MAAGPAENPAAPADPAPGGEPVKGVLQGVLP